MWILLIAFSVPCIPNAAQKKVAEKKQNDALKKAARIVQKKRKGGKTRKYEYGSAAYIEHGGLWSASVESEPSLH